MISLKQIIKILPWFLLIVIVFTMYISNQWPFNKKIKQERQILETSVILKEVEKLGKLELVRYNFKEVFEYKRLSNGKIVGNSILNSHDYDPDLSVILIATGEAVGCIDLTKLEITDIDIDNDSIVIYLPAPELCYHKLDLENTKIYSFNKESWWSRMFADESEKNAVLQMAYNKAESRLKEAAIESGIFYSTNENVENMLKPLLNRMTGKSIRIVPAIPEVDLEGDL